MTSLRVRMAMLLVVAIISVVALASIVAVSLVGLPDPDGWFDSIARQIQAAERAAMSGNDDGIHAFRPAPAGGTANDEMTGFLRQAMARIGDPLNVVATTPVDGAGMVISVPVNGKGWITIDLLAPPRPRGGWAIFIGWMLLIIAGAIAVSLFLTYVMTRPLRLIENAVANVGRDGTLPPIPETGSPEVRTTARALNRLSARLKSAIDSRMRLVAAAGHDLRTPMTRMRLRAEFLGDEERAEWLRDLDELDRIADSAIGLVREEVEGSSGQKLDLAALTGEVVAELAALGRDVRTGTIAAATIEAGPLALKRALRNLIINAATHGGGATVSVAASGGKASVIIEDSGPGIPPELIDRVFEPFFRVDPARRQSVPGAGLGLAIAKEIITRQGGSLNIANRGEGGLRQVVSFRVQAGGDDTAATNRANGLSRSSRLLG